MCVIFLVNNVRPTDEMISRAWSSNSHGGGIAWREGEGDDAEVVWRKGLNEETLTDLCKRVPTPYVAHFRIASVGGKKEALTHPFLVAEHAPLLLNGRTKRKVLFHNGHWGLWDIKAMDTAISANLEVPEGPWSDTRAMAWLTHIYGPGFMELLPSQKGILMGPRSLNIFSGSDGWTKINEVWCSNKGFWENRYGVRTVVYSGTRLCAFGNCKVEALTGSSYCKDHPLKAGTVLKPAPVAASNVGGTATKFLPLVKEGIILLSDAEILYRRTELSKTLLKRIRKEHEIIAAGKNTAEIGKAKKKLVAYTNVILGQLSSGRAV